MTNNTKTMSRRYVVGGAEAASVTTTLGPAVPAEAAPPSQAISPRLLELLDTHARAHSNLDAVCAREPDSTNPENEERRRWTDEERRANESEGEAYVAILDYAPQSLTEAAAIAARIVEVNDRWAVFEHDRECRFIQTLAAIATEANGGAHA